MTSPDHTLAAAVLPAPAPARGGLPYMLVLLLERLFITQDARLQ